MLFIAYVESEFDKWCLRYTMICHVKRQQRKTKGGNKMLDLIYILFGHR